MHKVTCKQGTQSLSIDMTNKQLASFCVEMAGGGVTEKQVVGAMHMQERLLSGQPVDLPNGVTLSIDHG